MIVGRWYVDPGRRPHRRCPGRAPGVVLVLVQWRGRGPRNVLVRPHLWWVDGLGWVYEPGIYEVLVDGEPTARRAELRPSGDAYVRPFRGLRRPIPPLP